MAGVSTYDQLKKDRLRQIELLTDPSSVEFVAEQMLDPTLNQNVSMGAARPNDLTDAIIDIVIETAAQGSGTLEVHILDPFRRLTQRPGDGRPAFIDTDDAGLLIPVDVNFPESTDCWWRLCAAEISLATDQANLLLTFEDRIVSELRDLGGPVAAANIQTRAMFIYTLVKQVPEIRFVCPALTAPAGTVGGNLTQGQINQLGNPSPAASSTQPMAPAARANGTKQPGITRQAKHSKAFNPASIGLTAAEFAILTGPTNVLDGPPTGAGSEPNT